MNSNKLDSNSNRKSSNRNSNRNSNRKSSNRKSSNRNSNRKSRKNSNRTLRIKSKKISSNNNNILSNVECNSIETILSVSQSEKFLKELGKGTYGIAFKGCFDLPECKRGISVKYISISSRYGKGYHDLNHPSNVEYRLGIALSKLVYADITPHINITFGNLKCSFNKLKHNKTFKQLKANEWLKLTQNKLNNNEIYPKINVVFNELANMDLKTYVLEQQNNLDHLDHIIIFFQFCYSLTCIQYYFKNFKHLDIKPNNLLVELIDIPVKRTNKYVAYNIFGKTFYLPQTKYVMKLYDFDFGYSDAFKNKKITESTSLKEKGYISDTNCLYDLHSYINYYYHIFSDILSEETKNLLKSLAPADNNIIYTDDSFSSVKLNTGLENTLLGKYSSYTNKFRLSTFKKDGNFNYIPKKMYSCADLLCHHNVFDRFTEVPNNSIIIKKYNSKIPELNENNQKNRPDMFNIGLHT